MKDTLKKVGVAMLAAIAYGAATQIGQALGEIARDKIKERLTPKPPEPKP